MKTRIDLLQGSGLGVHQVRKFFELRNEYTLVDETGATVGLATQERQGWMALLLRVISDLDVVLPTSIDVRDIEGVLLLSIDKPWLTRVVTVVVPDGTVVGRIRKKIRMGKARFVLEDAGGAAIGEIRARNWRAKDFDVIDDRGDTVATVTKKWRGLFTEAFTDADSYAIEFADGASEQMRVLAFAGALAVDIVMKEKD